MEPQQLSVAYNSNIEDLTDPHSLQLTFTKLNPRKATTDLIPPMVFASSPDVLARAYHPLYTKMQLRIAEPLRLKGSLAHPLYKQGMHTHTMLDYRSISIRSLVIKTHHAHIRDIL